MSLQVSGRSKGGARGARLPYNDHVTFLWPLLPIVASVASGISRLNQPTYIVSPKV